MSADLTEPRSGLRAGDLGTYRTMHGGRVLVKVTKIERDGDDWRVYVRVTGGSDPAYPPSLPLILRPTAFLSKRGRACRGCPNAHACQYGGLCRWPAE